jgi:nitroreductase
METWDAITSRRNVREFEDRPLPGEHLERILEAGRRAPSSRNWQPWDFVVVTDRDQLTELAKVWRGAGHVAGSAATIALILPTPTTRASAIERSTTSDRQRWRCSSPPPISASAQATRPWPTRIRLAGCSASPRIATPRT